MTLDDLAREYARCLSGVERDENVLPVGAAALMLAEARLGNDPANTQWQRDLSVSHERIGDVLVAQGDGPGALTAYRQGLAIAETLTARSGQHPVAARSRGQLCEAWRGHEGSILRRHGLEVALGMQKRGILAPRDAWMIDELKRRSGNERAVA